MAICIECRYPVKTLYTTYSKADDRALGKGVRLTQCPRCKRFADKYVEHDFVVLFIDLVLIKPQVYRHLLFNRLGRDDDRFDPSIVRLGILLLLFDVYLTWARIEKASPLSLTSANGTSALSPASLSSTSGAPSLLSTQPLVLQYLFFLALVFAETLAFHIPIRLLCMHPPRWPSRWSSRRTSQGTTGTSSSSSSAGAAYPPSATIPAATSAPGTTTASNNASSSSSDPAVSNPQPPPNSHPQVHLSPFNPIPYYPHPVPLSTALLVSSCTKLFPILLIIWEYDLPSSASAVSWAVIVNNIAALEILMDCGYIRASVLVAIGAACRALVAWAVLNMVGLGDVWGVGGASGGGMGAGVEEAVGLGFMGVWGDIWGWGGWLVRGMA